MKTFSAKTHERGVGIVEAMVSLLVLALGMMSIAALQGRLRLNSDVAKQRSEAVRIAQEDIENFRSFGTFAVNGAITNNFAYDSIVAGASNKTVLASTVVTKTNTTFTVTRTVADAPRSAGITDAPVKNLSVSVAWADRSGTSQNVTLRSVISRSDPAVAGSLALAPNGSPVRDLLGRDIQVPIPAKSLGDGTSAIKPLSSGTIAYVFSNDTGVVTKRCTGLSSSLVTNNLTTGTLSGAGVTCNDINAYLVSGFVRTALGSNPSATSPNDTAPGGVAMRMDFDSTAPPTGFAGTFTQLTAAYWPTITSGTGTTIGSGATYSPAECNAEPLQTIRYTTPVNFTQVNNGVTTTVTTTTVVAIIPQSVTSITPANVAPWVGVAPGSAATMIVSPQATGERFVGFACLVYPIDLDNNPSTAAAYTARLAVWPTSGWALGATSTTYKVCRYSADYNLNGGVRIRTDTSGVVNEASGAYIRTIDNQEHTYAYLNAQKSLSNQNFLIIDGNRTCPTDAAVEVDGQGGENYTDESTVTHQP
jgi:Tfp pilus assembly protein PilV